jgi:hypothetical protein
MCLRNIGIRVQNYTVPQRTTSASPLSVNLIQLYRCTGNGVDLPFVLEGNHVTALQVYLILNVFVDEPQPHSEHQGHRCRRPLGTAVGV